MTSNAKKNLAIDSISDVTFPPRNFRISSKSVYSDSTWDFSDNSKARLKGHSESKLVICWNQYELTQSSERFLDGNFSPKSHLDARIGSELLEQVKSLCLLQLELPDALIIRRRQVRRIKASTLVKSARVLVLFLSLVDNVRANRIKSTISGFQYRALRQISEITYQDLESALKVYPFADGEILERCLRLLTSPLLGTKLPGFSTQWTIADLDNFNFPTPAPRSDYKRVMPDEMFRLISNTASRDVTYFLHATGLSRYDTSVPIEKSHLLCREINLSVAWEDYVAIRVDDRVYSAQIGKKASRAISLRKKFLHKHGMSTKDFFHYISNLQQACIMLIGLYTGVRFSDFTSFVSGCIRELFGMPVLIGTVTKHRNVNAPENGDVWPAIPIIRDAVGCLEQISRVTFNPYFISSSATVRFGDEAQPMSLSGFRLALNNYLRSIDTGQKWRDWVINPHQLRHTLAHKLAQADVGIVYISYQLKHLYTALATMPAAATIGYGNVGDQKLHRAMAVAGLSRESAHALYSPDSPIAGGGAQEFKRRRRAYFDGRIAEGWTEDEIIDQLAASGSPFVSVGLGYCGGVREEVLADGSKQQPPCIGSLQCNPGDCDNAIISQVHVLHWKNIVAENKRLISDPRLSHAAENFRAAISTGERVLNELGLNPVHL